MRILMLTHNIAGRGGSFVRAHALGAQLVRRGHSVTLLAAARQMLHPQRTEIDGVTVIETFDLLPTRWRNAGLSPIDAASRVLTLLTGAHFDLVHGFEHRPSVSIPAGLYHARTGAPYITDWADLWGTGGFANLRHASEAILGRADQRAERGLVRRASAVTVISLYLYEEARRLGVPPERLIRIPMGANTELITPLPQAAMRVKHGLPADVPIIGYSGFTTFEHKLLAEVFIELASAHPTLMLLVISPPVALFEGAIKRAGLADRVRRVNPVPYAELGEWLACMDVALLPHPDTPMNRARFPIKLGDYLAAGLPVVTHGVGDVGMLIESTGVGCIAAESTQDFARCIGDLLADAPARAATGQRARHLAETQLGWDQRAAELEGLYLSLL